MEAILGPLKEDLLDLYCTDSIKSAKQLNAALGKTFFSERQKPMHFIGQFDAKTVFVMLNPGSAIDDNYSFAISHKNKCANFDDFFEKYKNYLIEYGIQEENRNKMDNFDLKQAAFLFDFKDSGVKICDFFDEPKEVNKLKLAAKENVLLNKLQLELIPYNSNEFRGTIDSLKKARQNIDAFMPHIERLLDAIICYERKYVIFGSKKFVHLFRAYCEKTEKQIEISEEYCDKVKVGMKHKVTWRTITIAHKGKIIQGIIPQSFPRRDLPNAYLKMRTYGQLCYNEFLKRFGEK